MTDSDWQRLEGAFQAAAEMPPEERAAYFETIGTEAPWLREEVETLVDALDRRRDFLERPALSLGLQLLGENPAQAPLEGKTIGNYRILSLLGKGGMGEVYLAEDLALARRVALKFVSHRLVDDAWSRRQLIKEAQAIAQLDHPNICAVYGVERQAGYDFIVMQYVPGETLAGLLQKGRLPVEIALSLGRQIVAALAKAHAHGIIHRDIKPQNIIVTAESEVKVLDFGLAKFVPAPGAVEERGEGGAVSQAGLILGTVAYMSPEQLRGERLDFRTDLFSFGTLLHEMISGVNPFAKTSQAETISAILTTDSPQPRTPSAEAAGLMQIAQKCLKRDREERYASASEILLDFDNLQQGRQLRAPGAGHRRAWWGSLLFLLLSIAIGGIYLHSGRAKRQTLAVLPLIAESPDANTDELGDRLTTNLADRLARVANIAVKTPTAPFDRGRLADPQRLARELSAETLFIGGFRKRGESLSFHFTLLRAADGARIWGEERRIAPRELEVFPQELAIKIALLLQFSLNDEGRMLLQALAASQNKRPEAYELYLRGRYYWNSRDTEKILSAIECFEQAIDLEPTYALAYTGQADSYLLMSTVAFGRPMSTREAMIKARAAIKKALEIDNQLCEAHTSLGVYSLRYEWNWPEAEKAFRQAIDLNPEYAPAHYWYANLLALTGRSDQAIAESEKAWTLEPFTPHSNINLARTRYYARQYEAAAALLERVLGQYPDQQSALNVLGYVYLQQGRMNEAIARFEKLYRANKLFGAAPLGYAYGKAGEKEKALQTLDVLEAQAVPLSQEKALIHLGLGNTNEAVRMLREACAERFATYPFLFIEPFMNELRSDSRYGELARCAGFER
ncbi:MAG: protein kinase [Blastocatellia bacterium]|nr:protein kinase [Blastocatellia bacterium]